MKLSFVCLGNICRSPMAEVIFRQLAADAGVTDRFTVTSRGIGDWHEGQPADPRTIESLRRAGYDGARHVAHQVTADDIADHDLLIAMDRSHERALREQGAERVELFTAYVENATSPDIFDPYFSDDDAFDRVRDEVERGCRTLLTALLGPSRTV